MIQVIQLISLINEIKKIFPLLISNKSTLFSEIMSLKNNESTKIIFSEIFKEQNFKYLGRKDLKNYKISEILFKKFSVF